MISQKKKNSKKQGNVIIREHYNKFVLNLFSLFILDRSFF